MHSTLQIKRLENQSFLLVETVTACLRLGHDYLNCIFIIALLERSP